MSKSRRVDAGEVEVEHAGEASSCEHDVVAEQVAVDRAARQRRVGRRRGEVLLVGELVLHQRRAARRSRCGSDDRHGLAPPGEAAQVRLVPARSRAPARCRRASTLPTLAQSAASGAR